MGSSPARHFGELLPLGEGWACRNREQRDERHSPGQLSQVLKSGFLEAEPEMGILDHGV